MMSAEDRAALGRKTYTIDGVTAEDEAPLSEVQFAELLRVVRETVRAEIRAEFEGRRVAAPQAWFGPSRLEYILAAGKPGCTDPFSVHCAEQRQRMAEEALQSDKAD